MGLDVLRNRGYELPPIETVEGLEAKDIHDKILSFYRRLEKARDDTFQDCAAADFLELLRDYPQSLCSKHMSESQKLLMAILYFESKPDSKDKDACWRGFSYEELSILFDVSKATVHEAIRQKEAEVKQLLEKPKLRTKARAIALEELVKEEKLKLLRKKPKET